MKNINKILAGLLIGLLTIGNVAAEGFPEEPMVIYGNIIGNNIDGKNLKISDGENKLLKEIKISNTKYGTDKILDINNKILLSPFTGTLNFKIDGYNFLSLSEGNGTTCEKETYFQKGNICEYNLSFNQIVISRGGGGGGSSYRKSKSSNVDADSIIPEKNNTNSSKKNDSKKIDSRENDSDKNINNKVKRNKEGKIIIKGIDYIKTVKTFNAEKKEIKSVLGYKVLNIKGNNSYNKTITNYTKTIYKDIKLDGIRKSMIRHMDSMTKTFGILSDPTLNNELKEIYTAKLKEDREYFELKMKTLKIKDTIIRNVLEKRKKIISLKTNYFFYLLS